MDVIDNFVGGDVNVVSCCEVILFVCSCVVDSDLGSCFVVVKNSIVEGVVCNFVVDSIGIFLVTVVVSCCILDKVVCNCLVVIIFTVGDDSCEVDVIGSPVLITLVVLDTVVGMCV